MKVPKFIIAVRSPSCGGPSYRPSVSDRRSPESDDAAAGPFEVLLAGNDRHVSGVSMRRDLSAEVAATGRAVPVGCRVVLSRPRTAPEQMFDQGVGDLFVGRIAGNFAGENDRQLRVCAQARGAKVLAVVGHTGMWRRQRRVCHAKLGNLTSTLAALQPAIDAVPASVKPRNAEKPSAFVQKVADANVRFTVDHILGSR